jgi:trypsin
MKGAFIVLVSVLSVALADINGPDCGNRPFHTARIDEGKVVGGNESIIGDHPWQIALLRFGSFSCGGSIIDANTVLCAAHCTTLNSPTSYTIVRTSTRNPRESWSQERNVVKIVNHPSYSGSTFKNDVSLLFVDKPWDFDEYTKPICLDTERAKEEVQAIATGWGTTASGGVVQNKLREAYMPITKESAVASYYGNSYDSVTMIGAANVGDGLDTCQGDSGGPLSIGYNSDRPNDLKRLKQVGIVSWGYGCGDIGVYSRVSTYIDWIRQTIRDNTGGK